MINPTPGRVLWFYRSVLTAYANEQPQAAIVAFVRHERCVNIALLSINGDVSPLMNVPLLQEDDCPPLIGGFAVWMPYQVNQAKQQEGPSSAQLIAELFERVFILESKLSNTAAKEGAKAELPPPAAASHAPTQPTPVQASASVPKQVTK